jgi:competence protein ComEA
MGAALTVLALLVLSVPDVAGPAGGVGQSLDGPSGVAGASMLSSPDLGAGSNGLMGRAAVDEIVVDVAGAVVQPGLHRLRSGDRVGDAIEAAGGFAPRVDLAEAGRSLNLAAPLSDGGKVLVPELGVDGPLTSSSDDGRIDLNQADQAGLESLPGVGPVTADKIMAARSEQRFGSVAELLDRGIVGQSVYDDIVDLVRVSG